MPDGEGERHKVDVLHRSGSNQGTDYIANDCIVLSSWISSFLWHKLKKSKAYNQERSSFVDKTTKFIF